MCNSDLPGEKIAYFHTVGSIGMGHRNKILEETGGPSERRTDKRGQTDGLTDVKKHNTILFEYENKLG